MASWNVLHISVSDVNANQPHSGEGLFVSSVGVEVLSKTLQQIADTRLKVVRDILILLVAAQRLFDKVFKTFSFAHL